MYPDYKKIFKFSKYKETAKGLFVFLKKKQFVKNFLTLVGGNFSAQLITITLMPVITRIYSPAEFGLFALFMAINNSICNVGSLTYERAILLTESEEDTFLVILLSFLILTGVCIILFIIIFLFNSELALLFKNNDIGFWLYFIPLAIFLYGLNRIATLYRLKYKYFKLMSVSKVVKALSSSALKIVLGLSATAYGGWLILSQLISDIFCFLTLLKRPSSQSIRSFLAKTSWEGMNRVALKFKKFPIYLSWAALLNFFSKNSVVFVLSIIFTPAIVGYYSLCNRALGQPLGLISDSIQNVYYQKTASQKISGQFILPQLVKLVLILSVSAILPTIILIMFGNHIFVFLFGEEWLIAGQYVRVVSPWFFFLFVGTPTKIIFDICQKQEFRLILNIIVAFSRVGSLFLGSFLFADALKVIAFFIVINSLLELLELFIVFYIARKSDLNLQNQSHL